MAPPPMANPPKRKSSQSSPSSSSVSLPVSGIALGLLAGLGVAIAARWTHSHKQKRKNSTPNTPPHQAPMFTDPARSSTDVINNDQERGEDDEDCRLLELPCPPLSTGPVGACLAEYDLLLQTSSLIDDGDSLHHEAAMARTCVTSTERPHENTIPAQNHGHPSATEAAQQCLGAPMQPWTLQSQSVLSSARHGGNTGSFAELDQKQDPSSSVLVEGENVLGGSIAVSEGLSDAGLDRDAKAMGTVSAAEDYSEDDFRAMQDGSLVPDIEGDSENRFPAMGDDCGDGFHHKGVPLQRWEMQVPKESADSAAVSESESGLDGDTKDMTTVSATESNSGHCFPTMEDGSGGRFPAIEDDTGSDFPAMEDGSGVLDREEDSRVDFPAMEEGSRDPDKGYESGNRFLVVDDKFGDGSLLRECVPSQIPAVQSPPVVSPSHHGRDSGSSVEREGQKQQSSVLKEEEENESAASSAAASEGFSDSAANGGAKVAGTVFSGHGFLAIEDDPEERLEESSGERYPAVKEDSGDDFPAMQDCSGHPDMENGNRFTTVEDNIGNSPVLREGVTLQTSEVLSPSVVSPSCDGHNGGSSVEPDEQQQQHEQPSSLPIQEEEDKSGGCGAASERFSELAFGGYAKGVSTVSSVEENTGHDFLVAIEDSSGERVPTVTEGSGDDCTAMEDGSSGPDKEDDLRHDFPATENVSGDPDKRDDSGNCFTVVEDNLGDSSCFREGVFLQRLEVQIPSVVFHSRVPTVMEDSGDDCTAMEDGSSGPDKEDDLGHDFPATENVSGDPDKTDDSRNCFTVVEDNLGDSSCFQEGVSLQRLEVQIPSVGFPSRVPTVTDDSGDDCTAMEDGSAGPDKEDDLGHDFPAAENVSGDPDKTDDSGNCFTVVEDNLGDSSRFREGASLQRLEVQIPSVVFPSHSVHNGEPSVEQQQEQQEQKQPSSVLIKEWENESAGSSAASERFSASILNGDAKDASTVSAMEDGSGHDFHAIGDVSGERFLAMEDDSMECILSMKEDSGDDILAMEDGSASPVHPDTEEGSGDADIEEDSGNHFPVLEDSLGGSSLVDDGIPSKRWEVQSPSVVPPLCHGCNRGSSVEQEQKQPSTVLMEDGKDDLACCIAASERFSESALNGDEKGVQSVPAVEDDSGNGFPALKEPVCLITKVEESSDACILADEGSNTQSVVKGSHEACIGSDNLEDMPRDGSDVHNIDPRSISVTMLLHHSSSFSTGGGYPSLPMTLDGCSVNGNARTNFCSSENGHSPVYPLCVDESDSLHLDGDPAVGSTSSMGSNTEGELNPQFTVQGFHKDVSLAAIGSTGSLDRNTDGELNPQSTLQESHKDVHLFTANDESRGKSVMDDDSSTSSNGDGDHDHRSTASIFNNDGFSWQNSESTVEASVEIDDCCLSDHGYSHLKLSSERPFHDSFAIGLSELPSTGDSLDDVDLDIDSGVTHYNTVAVLFDDNKEHKLPLVSGDTNCFILSDDVEHDIQSSVNGYDEPSIMHKEAIVRTFGHEDANVQTPEKNNFQPAASEYHNTCSNADVGDYNQLTADVHMSFQSTIVVCEEFYPHAGVDENKPLIEKSDNTSMNVMEKPTSESIVVNACGVLLPADGCDDLHLSLEQCDTCADGNSTLLSVMQDSDNQYENQMENESDRAFTCPNEDHDLEDDSTSASLIKGNMPDVQSTIHGTFDQCINCSAENHVVQPKMEHDIWSSDDGSRSFPSNILVDDERQRSVISKASSGGSSLCQSAVEHTDTATFISEIHHQTKTGRSNELPQSANGNTYLQQDDIDETDARNYSTTGKSANDISSMSAVEVEFDLQSAMADECLNLHAGPKQLGYSSDELTDFQQSYLQKPDSSARGIVADRLSSENLDIQSTTEKPDEKHYFYQSIINCRIDENGDHPFPESIMSQCHTSADSESNNRLSVEDCDETAEEIDGETFPHSILDHSFHSDVSKLSILHTMTDDIDTDEIISDNSNLNNSEDECMRCMVKANTVDSHAVDPSDEHTPGVNGLGQLNGIKHAVDAIDRMDDKHGDVRPVVTGVTEVGISDEAVRKDGNTVATTFNEEAQTMEWQPRASGLAGDIKRRKRKRRGAKREEQASDATYGGTFSPAKDGVRRIETVTPYIVLGIGAICLLVSVINIVLHYLQTSQPLVNREEF